MCDQGQDQASGGLQETLNKLLNWKKHCQEVPSHWENRERQPHPQ